MTGSGIPLPDPVRRGEALRRRPRWVGRFLLLAAIYIALGISQNAARTALTERYLPPSASAGARAAAGEALAASAPVRLLFLPVRLFTGWSLFALVLYYTCRIWKSDGGARFVHLLAAEVYAEGALLAAAVAAAGAAMSGAGGTGPGGGVPWVPLGLDMLFGADDFTARYLLNCVNIFSIAYVAVLATTVSAMIGIPRVKAYASVLIAWGVALFVNAGIVHALRTEFSFGL